MGIEWQLAVALLGALAGPLISWIIGRQDRTDSRTVILKDLDILKAIDPRSQQYEKLNIQVTKRIKSLVGLQAQRELMMPIYRLYFVSMSFWSVYLATVFVERVDSIPGGWSGWLGVARTVALILATVYMVRIVWLAIRILRILVPLLISRANGRLKIIGKEIRIIHLSVKSKLLEARVRALGGNPNADDGEPDTPSASV